MRRKTYLERLSPKRKYIFGINLILIGIAGVFLPIIPGLLCMLLGLFFIYPKLWDELKVFMKKSNFFGHQ